MASGLLQAFYWRGRWTTRDNPKEIVTYNSVNSFLKIVCYDNQQYENS